MISVSAKGRLGYTAVAIKLGLVLAPPPREDGTGITMLRRNEERWEKPEEGEEKGCLSIIVLTNRLIMQLAAILHSPYGGDNAD